MFAGVNHGSESVRYLGPKIWEIIATHAKELDIIDKFKIATLLCLTVVEAYTPTFYYQPPLSPPPLPSSLLLSILGFFV